MRDDSIYSVSPRRDRGVQDSNIISFTSWMPFKAPCNGTTNKDRGAQRGNSMTFAYWLPAKALHAAFSRTGRASLSGTQPCPVEERGRNGKDEAR